MFSSSFLLHALKWKPSHRFAMYWLGSNSLRSNERRLFFPSVNTDNNRNCVSLPLSVVLLLSFWFCFSRFYAFTLSPFKNFCQCSEVEHAEIIEKVIISTDDEATTTMTTQQQIKKAG